MVRRRFMEPRPDLVSPRVSPSRLWPLGLAGAFLASVGLGCERVTFSAVEVASVDVSPSQESLFPGGTAQLSAEARDPSGGRLPDRPISWTSEDDAVVRVDADGLIAAHAPGTARVWASAGGRDGFATIIVKTPLIDLSQSSARFEAVAGKKAELSHELNVSGEGLFDLSVAVVHAGGEPAGWLDVALSGQTAPAVVTLTARSEGLPAGEYAAIVRVRDPFAENSPQLVAVSLRLTSRGGGQTP